jgi:hypothetical protein
MITVLKANGLFKMLNRKGCCTKENCLCGCNDSQHADYRAKLEYLEEKNDTLKEAYLNLREQHIQLQQKTTRL